MYHQVSVTLSKPQFDKLMRGQQIQLSHQQIGGGIAKKHHVMVHPATAKKIHCAMAKQKGVRICMTPHEMEASGEGLKEFWEKLKNAGKFIKDKIIDTPFYQQTVRPVAKNLVNQGIDTFVPAPARDVAHKGADFVGEKTGAFGIEPKRGRKSKAQMPMHPSMMQGHVVDGAYVWPQPIPNLVNWGVGVQPKRKQPARGKKPGSGSFRPA